MKFGRSHDSAPQASWHTAELDPSDAAYLKEELRSVRGLHAVMTDLGRGLQPGGSRTVVRIPVLIPYSTSVEQAIVVSAQNIAEIVESVGLEGADRTHPVVIQENVSAEQAGELPNDIKAISDSAARFGYIRVEETEAGPRASVGCFEPSTQSHYSMPL